MGRPKKNASSSVAPAKKIQVLEGTIDVLTETDVLWDIILKKLSYTAKVYGFCKIETPLIEDVQLYRNYYRSNKAVQDTLIVSEVGGRQVAVRPHILPSTLRSYYQNKVYDKQPLSKWFYCGPVTAQDASGKKMTGGYEFGFEVFGTFNHLTEAQVIGGVWEYVHALGLTEVTLEINTIGTVECQAVYQATLQDFLAPKKYDLCDNCNEALSGRVLDVFRCPNFDCQAIVSEAPTILDFLDEASHKYFTNILEALDELSIPYQLNPIYAGPEGYSKTNVIIKSKYKGQTFTIGEGGYHDELIQYISGKTYSCFGFTGSLLAIRTLLEENESTVVREQKNDVFLVPLGELASKKSLRLFRDLTIERISVYDHFGTIGVKNQLKQAEMFKAPIALIIGQKEAIDEMVILRDVKSGMQEIISYDKIVEEVKKRLGK